MEGLTESFVLPISGKPVTIKEGDGYEDKILRKKGKLLYEMVPEYLAAFVVEIDGKSGIRADDILDLLVPDQEYIAVERYRLNFGDELVFGFVCSSCGTPDDNGRTMNLTNLEKLPLYPGYENPNDPTWELALPRSKKVVRIGLLNGHKERLLMGHLRDTGTIDMNQADFQSLRTFDGSKDFSYEDVVNLKLRDHKAIRDFKANLVAGYDLRANVTCSSCGQRSIINVVTNRDFWLPGG